MNKRMLYVTKLEEFGFVADFQNSVNRIISEGEKYPRNTSDLELC